MGRKTKKQQALDLLKQLNKADFKDIFDSFDLGSTNNSYENVESLLQKECPNYLKFVIELIFTLIHGTSII